MVILNINPALMGEINKYAVTVTHACQLYIIPIAVTLTMGQSIFGALFSSHDNRIDFSPIIRGFLLVAILTGYPELVTAVAGIMDEFTSLISAKSKVTEFLNTYQAQNTGNESWTDFWVMKWIAGFLQENATALVRLTILSVRDVMVGFLIICGPIAISLSIIDYFKGLLLKWLQSFITIQFWALSLGLLDHIVKFFLMHLSAVDVTQEGFVLAAKTSLTGYIVTNLVCLIMYLLVPYLTSLYAGGSQAGMFMSKVISVGAAAMAPATKMLSAGKAVAGAAGAAGSAGASVAGVAGAAGASGTPYARAGSAGFSFSKKPLQD